MNHQIRYESCEPWEEMLWNILNLFVLPIQILSVIIATAKAVEIALNVMIGRVYKGRA